MNPPVVQGTTRSKESQEPLRRGGKLQPGNHCKSPRSTANTCPSKATLLLSVSKEFLDHLPEGGNFWIFHVCTQQQILQLGKRYLPSQSPAKLFVSTLLEGTLAWEHSDALLAPFRQISLPPEYFRHFFVKTGGQASAFDVWLPGGHC